MNETMPLDIFRLGPNHRCGKQLTVGSNKVTCAVTPPLSNCFYLYELLPAHAGSFILRSEAKR